VAVPLAAIYRQRFLFCEESIYISEYVEGVHLHRFLKDLRVYNKERYRIISRLTEQMAEILAGLHNKGLWHRDAKTTNFIVTGDSPDNYRLVLTDLDGIKQYSARRESCQMRALWQLAASAMTLSSMRRTDYLRMFKAYCDKTAIPPEQRGELFRELAAKARAKFKHKSQGQNGR
jgi:serine/threonine protein kinase